MTDAPTPDADTTPLALAARLTHEVQRTIDLITVGIANPPWEEASEESKEQRVAFIDRMWGKPFPDFYDFLTMPFRLMKMPCPDVSDESAEQVRYARMLHAIVHGVLGNRPENMEPAGGENQ